MKGIKVIKSLAWWIALAAALAFSLCFALPSFFPSKENTTNKKVISVWNVDTFEGGKGSRTSFLNSVAKQLEKEGDVLFMVSSKTVEGAKLSLQNGELPDLLSFGMGFEVGVSIGKADCWCMGKYALFSKSGVLAEPNASNTVVSCGGENLPLVAAALYGFSGGMTEAKSLQAYVDFLSGKYTYLLGTQRDAQRLIARGVEVNVLPLNGFSDLKQYIAVIHSENKRICEAFIEKLMAEETQRSLSKIGMLSERYRIYDANTPISEALERGDMEFTLPHNATAGKRQTLLSGARRVLAGSENVEFLKKILKGS